MFIEFKQSIEFEWSLELIEGTIHALDYTDDDENPTELGELTFITSHENNRKDYDFFTAADHHSQEMSNLATLMMTLDAPMSPEVISHITDVSGDFEVMVALVNHFLMYGNSVTMISAYPGNNDSHVKLFKKTGFVSNPKYNGYIFTKGSEWYLEE